MKYAYLFKYLLDIDLKVNLLISFEIDRVALLRHFKIYNKSLHNTDLCHKINLCCANPCYANLYIDGNKFPQKTALVQNP